MQRSALCRSRRELSNAYLLANFGKKIEIAELCKEVHCVGLGESFPTNIYLQNLASIQPRTSPPKFFPLDRCSSPASRPKPRCSQRTVETLEGSFSAVSRRNFASKYAFESSRRDPHNALFCTTLQSHFCQKFSRGLLNL